MASAPKKKAVTRKTTVKKTAVKTAKAPHQIFKRADEKYIGSEVTVFDGVDIDQAIQQNLRHCNYFYSRQDAAGWIGKWIQNNLTPVAVREFKAAETWRSCIAVGTLCKMHSGGAPLSDERLTWIKTKIENEILKYGRINLKPTDKKPVTNRTNPALLVKLKGEQVIADLEAVVDSWDNLTTYSLYNELKSNQIPALIAKAISEYYLPLMEELQAAILPKADPQLKEAYGLDNKSATVAKRKLADLKKYAAFIESLVNDAKTYLTGKNAARKPRAKKEKSAGLLVQKVKYQKESKELKITSVHPEKIIGAQAVLLFNTKYNAISYLVSSSKTGFSITGTTVQNIDNEQSFKKTIRKANENLPAIVSAPKAKTIKMITELKTAQSSTTGRIGEDTLILKVF